MGAPGPSMGGWLGGRASRREYWLWVVGLLAFGLIVQTVTPALNLVGASLMTCLQIRRLHDFGRTGWWAGAVLIAQIPAALALYAVMGARDETFWVGDVFVAIPVVVIGVFAGDRHENRFGPAPGARSLRDVFS